MLLRPQAIKGKLAPPPPQICLMCPVLSLLNHLRSRGTLSSTGVSQAEGMAHLTRDLKSLSPGHEEVRQRHSWGEAANHSVMLVRFLHYGRSRGRHQGHLPELLGQHSGSLLHTHSRTTERPSTCTEWVTRGTDPERGGKFGNRTHNKHTDYHSCCERGPGDEEAATDHTLTGFSEWGNTFQGKSSHWASAAWIQVQPPFLWGIWSELPGSIGMN